MAALAGRGAGDCLALQKPLIARGKFATAFSKERFKAGGWGFPVGGGVKKVFLSASDGGLHSDVTETLDVF